MRILFIEDQENAAETMQELCTYLNIGCDVATDGKMGLEMGQQPIYDVIVLDLMLPELSGVEVLRQLRAKAVKTPVIILTAISSVEDKVKLFDLGANDYVVKPFSAKELFARIRALARRPENDTLLKDDNLMIEDVVFNPFQKRLSFPGHEETLTTKESLILEVFFKNPNTIFSRERILDIVWGEDSKDVNSNNIEIYIHNLRKKLEGSKVKIITVRSTGYMLGAIE